MIQAYIELNNGDGLRLSIYSEDLKQAEQTKMKWNPIKSL